MHFISQTAGTEGTLFLCPTVQIVFIDSEYDCHCAWKYRKYRKIDRFIELQKKYEESYPKASDQLKCIALEMCIDASLNKPTEWPH